MKRENINNWKVELRSEKNFKLIALKAFSKPQKQKQNGTNNYTQNRTRNYCFFFIAEFIMWPQFINFFSQIYIAITKKEKKNIIELQINYIHTMIHLI